MSQAMTIHGNGWRPLSAEEEQAYVDALMGHTGQHGGSLVTVYGEQEGAGLGQALGRRAKKGLGFLKSSGIATKAADIAQGAVAPAVAGLVDKVAPGAGTLASRAVSSAVSRAREQGGFGIERPY